MNFTIDQWSRFCRIMYSTHNERKSVVAERFIRTLKNTFYKYMTSIWKTFYCILINYIILLINTAIRLIEQLKIKPLGVTLSTYIDSSKEIDNKVPKFKIGDLTISEYKNIFEKVMFWIGLKKFLWLNKV